MQPTTAAGYTAAPSGNVQPRTAATRLRNLAAFSSPVNCNWRFFRTIGAEEQGHPAARRCGKALHQVLVGVVVGRHVGLQQHEIGERRAHYQVL